MRKALQWIIYSILFFTGLLGVNNAGAQTIHPVTASLQLVPPYSVYLADYAAPGNDKLRAILTLNDLSQPSYTIRLRLKVELNGRVIMQTDPVYRGSAITLMPGMPQIITGSQLNEYLVSDHLQFVNGFSRENYERTKALPEGAYRICVTAYDYNRSDDVAISNDGCNIFFFQKNEAPLLNFPLCNSRVDRKDPQFLSFTWSIRNTPSFVTGSSGTGYRFELFEVRPAGSNPEYIVRSSTPIYTTTTDNATLLYGPGEPRLQDSMQYVWRVQAYDKDGRDAYQNNGYSQACVFTYGGLDPFAVNNVGKPELLGEALGERSGKWWWHISNAKTVDGWNLQYRKHDTTGSKNDAFDWNKQYLTDTSFLLFNLEPDNTYEAQVQPVIRGIAGSYSETVLIRTMPKRVYECGKDDAANNGDTGVFKPLNSAIAGMIVRVGDFDMQLLEVSGGNGRFSGYGAIATPLLGMRLNVKFTDVTINDKLQLTQGEAIALTEGIEAWIKDRTKVHDDVETIKGWSEKMPDFETGSLSELKDFADELLGISEGIWNDTYVYTEEERKQVKDALAEIKAAMQELGDSDPANDAAAEKKLRDTLKKVKPLLEKISENIGKGVFVQLGLTRNKLYKAIVSGYVKELQTSIASLINEREAINALAKHGPYNDNGVKGYAAALPACIRSLSEEKQKELAEYLKSKISNETDWNKYAETLQANIAKQQADEAFFGNTAKEIDEAATTKTDLTIEDWATANTAKWNDNNERFCPYVLEKYEADQKATAYLSTLAETVAEAFSNFSLPSNIFVFNYGIQIQFLKTIKNQTSNSIEVGGKKYMLITVPGTHQFIGFYSETLLQKAPRNGDGTVNIDELNKLDAANNKEGWLPKDGNYEVVNEISQPFAREVFEDLMASKRMDNATALGIARALDGVNKEIWNEYLKEAWEGRSDQEIGLYEMGFSLSSVEDFQKDLAAFLIAIKNKKETLLALNRRWYAEPSNQSKIREKIIVWTLWKFEDKDYLALNNSQRDSVLKILNDGNLHSWNLGDKIATNLVTKVPEADQKAWLELLSKGSRLQELFTDVDGDEFRELIMWLSKVAMSKFPRPKDLDLKTAILQNKFVPFKEGLFTGYTVQKTIDENGNITLSTRPQFTDDEKTAKGLKATDWVYVRFNSPFKLNDKVSFIKGTKMPMPAILAYAIFNEENNRRLIQGGKFALDVTLMAIGVGEITAAMQAATKLEKAIRVTKAIVDLGMGLGDIVVSDILINKLNETEKGKAFLDTWNTIQLYYGLGSIGAEVGLYARKLYKEGKALKELDGIGKLDNDLQQELDKVMDDIETQTGVANVGRTTMKGSEIAYQVFDWTVKVSKQTGKVAIQIFKDGGEVALAFLKGKSKMFEGKMCMMVPFAPNIAGAAEKMQAILKEIKANGFLRDAEGKIVFLKADEAVATVEDAAGNIIPVIVKEIGDFAAYITGKLKNKDLQLVFKKDFANNAAFKKLIEENEDLIDAWEALHTAGYNALRTDADELAKINKLIKDKNLSLDEAVDAINAEKGIVKGKMLGSITKNGNETLYTNPAGKVLTWKEQGTNGVETAIESARKGDAGKKVEAKVADFLTGEGKTIEAFGMKVKKANGQTAGDFDVLTNNELIEVKKSMTAWETKMNQMEKFAISTKDDFMNPLNKKVILYIDEPLSELDKAKVLNTIPGNVTLVTSLTELKAIIK
jgi:TANFOR domain-containing protein